jgi:DUF218 domain
MDDRLRSSIIVASVDDAEQVAIELVRNVLVANPQANLFAAGVEAWSKLHSFIANEAPRYGSQTDKTLQRWDVCIVGANCESLSIDPVRTLIALPGTRDAIEAKRRVDLELGSPEGDVIMVPGTARTIDGSHTVTAETFGRLRRAEKIAMQRPIRALILSGWNGGIENCRSEAAQMLDAWRGPQVPIILDEAARTTAENVLWAASLAYTLGSVHKIEIVAAWVSAVRLGLATFFAFRKTKISTRLSVVWGCVQATSWRPSIVGLVYLKRHLKNGRYFILNGSHTPKK